MGVSVLFLQFRNFEYVACICHALNNVHEVGVVDEKKIIPRVRILVKTVKKPKAKKLFRGDQYQRQTVPNKPAFINKLNQKHVLYVILLLIYFITEITKQNDQKMPLDVKTKWNSVLPMLRGAHSNRTHLSKYAIQHGKDEVKKSVPIDSEWEDVKSLADFLQPLDAMTKECSAVEQSSFHLGKATLDQLQYVLKTAEADITKV